MFSDFSYGDAFRIEYKAVRFDVGLTDMLKKRSDAFRRCLPIPQQVQVLGWPMKMPYPGHEEQGAFQDELIGVSGLRESVEQSLECKLCQEQIEILSGFIPQIQQALVDRC